MESEYWDTMGNYKTNKLLVLFSIFSMVCLSACLDFNNMMNIKNIQNTNTNTEMGDYNTYKRNLEHFSNNSTTNVNNTNVKTKLPISIEYDIVEYGKYGKQDKEYYYNYIDKCKNKTIIAIYGGKKPIDYNIEITKIVKNSNNSIMVYINKSIQNNNTILITSPYIIVEVNGIFENIKYIDN